MFKLLKHTRFFCWTLCALLALPAGPAALHAQLTFDPAKSADEHGPVKNKPFTADKLLTIHKTLADGTKSTQESTVVEARDSAGRVVSVIRPLSSGRAQAPIAIEIHTVLDMDARTVLTWTSMTKEGNLMHLPAPRLKVSGLDGAKGPAEREPPKPDQLGHRMIGGLLATGTRVESTTAPGAMGNDEAIESKTDTWFADEMKLVVLREESSPKNGETRIELTDLRPGEPDPALFHMPAGYTVRDRTPAPPPSVAGASHTTPPPAVDMAHLPTLTYDAALAQLSDPTPLTRANAAAVLVKMATDDADLQQKDKVAYELARKKMNLDDARKLAQQAVDGAEKMSAASFAATPPVHRTGLERTLAHAWDTLGYVYGRQGDAELERRYLLSAWTLDPLAYYGNHLGRAYENAGQSAQASEVYAEALAGRGSDEMKQAIRDRLSAFTTSTTAAGVPVENSPAAQASGVLDIELGAKAPAQATFVSGDEALKPVASEIGVQIAAMWPAPDDGPERILRRVSVTCVAAQKPACHARPVGTR